MSHQSGEIRAVQREHKQNLAREAGLFYPTQPKGASMPDTNAVLSIPVLTSRLSDIENRAKELRYRMAALLDFVQGPRPQEVAKDSPPSSSPKGILQEINSAYTRLEAHQYELEGSLSVLQTVLGHPGDVPASGSKNINYSHG